MRVFRTSGIVLLLLVALGSSTAFSAQGAASKTAGVDRSGSWFDPTHNGEGFVVQFIDDTSAVVYWFTYDEAGNQRWFTGLGSAAGNRLVVEELLITQGGVFGPSFDPDAIDRVNVGTLTITFSGTGDNESAIATYTINDVEGQQDLVRLTRPIEVAGLEAPLTPRKSGSWFDPTRSGEGFALEVLADGRAIVYWFTYDLDGNQAWMIGIGDESIGSGSFPLALLQPVGGRFGPNFDPDEVVNTPVGSARVSLQCTGGYADYVTTDPDDFVDLRFDLEQLIGVGPNTCEDPALTNRFPLLDGAVALPDDDAGRQFQWLLDLTARAEPATDEEIRERFAQGSIDEVGIDTVRGLLDDFQTQYPEAKLTDPIGITPSQIVGLITARDRREAFVVVEFSIDEGKITTLQSAFYGFGAGSVVTGPDRQLDLQGAANQFGSLSSLPGLLVARIDENDQCQPLVERSADVPRSIASIFKIYILGGVADALDDGSLFHDEIVPLDGAKQVPGGPLFDEPAGLEFTLDELATLMMGTSDNTATDMLLALSGRNRFSGLHAAYGHAMPNLMSPQLGISEQFHLFFSFPENEARTYVNGSEAFQRDFLRDRIVPLGSSATGGGGFFNEALFVEGAWMASPMDICGAFARHRQHAPGSDAALLVERALQSQAAQPNVREHWDRVWYKGGSLVSGANGLLVLTHAWLLEREGEQPIVVAAFSNDLGGGIDGFAVQSVLGRILELVRDL